MKTDIWCARLESCVTFLDYVVWVLYHNPIKKREHMAPFNIFHHL